MRFTREQKLIHHLVLHCNDVPSAIGLLNGEMGIVLVLAHYAKVRNNPYIEKVADFVIEQILDNLTMNEDTSFGYGLAGIGWGIEYLIQNGYLEGDSIVICEEIDKRIMSIDILRMEDTSFEKGLAGLLQYFLSHLQGGMKNGKLAFDVDYISHWAQHLQSLSKETKTAHENIWQEGLLKMEAILKQECYDFPILLRPLVKPMRQCPRNVLGLQDGLAGYIELMIEETR